MKKLLSVITSLAIAVQILLSATAVPVFAEGDDEIIGEKYTSPDTQVYNMNIDWKYKKPSTTFPLASAMASVEKDGKKFYEVDYDDSDWETVSVPHQVNASDSFTTLGSNAGDGGQYRGLVFYRKHFTVPSEAAGKKLFVEIEGMDNAQYIWINGQKLGYYEAGVAATGYDITDYVTAGKEAVIAIGNDSTSGRGLEAGQYYVETKPGSEWGANDGAGFQWNSHEFRPSQAGLVYNVNLYVKSEVYQTLPLYNNLKTTGNYIYADNFDIKNKKAKIHVKAELRNETAADKNVTLQVDVVKNVSSEEDDTVTPYLQYSFSADGTVKAASDAGAHFETVVEEKVYADGAVHEGITDVDTVDVSYIEASYDAEKLDFWSTEAPNLYDVYTILKDENGNVLDVQKTTTGFRKVEYSISDGLKINDKSVWLTGYAQRSSNEWAAIGAANDWLTDYDMSLVKESGSNFIRWMHIAPRVNSVRATDKYGIAVVAPAGDKEANSTGRQWSQRVEAMRSTIISFRNSPSVIFWETGNNEITAEHQSEMTALKAKLDPDGGRFIGCRTLQKEDEIQATEYVGTMLNRHAGIAFGLMKNLNKYMPIVETEYHREESARRVWDDYSPPDYDLDDYYKSDAATAGYDFYDINSEEFALSDARSYKEFFEDRVNGKSGNNYYTAAAALCWTDSNQHARTTATENGRMSGRVDAIRIPKESFYTYQVMQQEDYTSDKQLHIIGHWNYEPVDNKTREEGGNYYYQIKTQISGVWTKTGEWGRRDPTHKTVYVAGSQYVSRVELYIDGEKVGECDKADNDFIYAFPNIDVTKGDKVSAIAYDAADNKIAEDEIARAGEPAAVRLTPHTGNEGLLADGSDLMYFDVEVVDANGNVCPLCYDRIDFKMTGNAKFMGGYNSGYATNKTYGSWGVGETVIGKDYVYAECGVNRVFVKAGRSAGTISLTATLAGGSVLPVTVSVNSVEYPEEIKGGLTKHRQQELEYGKIKTTDTETSALPIKPLAKLVSVARSAWATSPLVYTAEKSDGRIDYTVTVNGAAVDFTNQAYKPDAASGVVCDLEPVLAALKKLGADFTYTVSEDKQTITVYSKKGQNGIDGQTHEFVIKQGQTAIGYDGDAEGILTNAQIEYSNGQLMLEIASLMSFIDGVYTEIDELSAAMNIVYGAN